MWASTNTNKIWIKYGKAQWKENLLISSHKQEKRPWTHSFEATSELARLTRRASAHTLLPGVLPSRPLASSKACRDLLYETKQLKQPSSLLLFFEMFSQLERRSPNLSIPSKPTIALTSVEHLLLVEEEMKSWNLQVERFVLVCRPWKTALHSSAWIVSRKIVLETLAVIAIAMNIFWRPNWQHNPSGWAGFATIPMLKQSPCSSYGNCLKSNVQLPKKKSQYV